VRIAVTGAAGRLGGQVAGILATAGEHQVVAVSRRPLAGAGPGPRGEVAAADYAGPAALRAALRGVDTLVFVSSDGEAVRRARQLELI
jgi:NAD(P)H dehydrogenase (quinone)